MIFGQAVKNVMVIAPVAAAGNAAAVTGTLDLLGCDHARVTVALAAEINTNAVGPTIVLTERDTTDGPWVTFDALATRTAEDLTAAKQVVFDINAANRKRYVRVSVTPATNTTNDGITLAATATLSRLAEAPATVAASAGAGDSVVIL